jgi:saccharopine dehydrogenase (NAD+, L-lysine-forming)
MSEPLIVGLIKEGKVPVDHRVPLSPQQCQKIMTEHPNIKIVVEQSDIRKFTDSDYRNAGVDVLSDMSECNILMGVKEVPVNYLIPEKTYYFFSHTIKMQPYNAKLLKSVLDKKIKLVDYELLADHRGARVIGFGKYAGIVGAYNGIRALGLRMGTFELKPAHRCFDRREMEGELAKVVLPEGYRVVLTGRGRVGGGALEILNKLPFREVKPDEFLTSDSREALLTVLNVEDYYVKEDGTSDKSEIYFDPTLYKPNFFKFAAVANMYISCHYWDKRAPGIVLAEDIKKPEWKIDVIADISCDINGPIVSTIRPSTIADPIYGYHRYTDTETSLNDPDAIAVMAVDNLPCELPRDASEDFGNEFINNVLPQWLNDDTGGMIYRATIADNGELTYRFKYLQDYADGTAAVH